MHLLLWVLRRFTTLSFTLLSSTSLFVLAALGVASVPSHAAVSLRISTQWPLSNASNLTFIHFKERVEADSKGEIHVEIYDGAKLYGDSTIASAISAAQVEMGYVNLSRYAAVIPAADAFQLPFMFNTAAIASAARARTSEIRTLIDNAILLESRARVLWWLPSGPSILLSRENAVADPASIAGKTVRTFGPMIEDIVKACGGIPRDIGGQGQQKAYETGAVDIGMSGISIVLERDLTRFMNVVTRTNHSSVEGVAVISEAFWQTLSPAHKGTILKAAEAADKEAAALLAEVETTGYKTLQAQGAKITDLTDEELLHWRICSSDVLTDFVEKAGRLGREVVVAYGRLRQSNCCNQAEGERLPGGISR